MRKSIFFLVAVVLLLTFVLVGTVSAEPNDKACWGQATQVFAKMDPGMGEHASSQPTPRAGLRNLARALYNMEESPLTDDTMQALGQWLNAELGLNIDACMVDGE